VSEPVHDEVLTLSEAARFIKVSEKTMRELAKNRKVPGKKVGREWRFLRVGLEDWLKGYTTERKPRTTPASARQLGLFKEAGFGDTAFTQNRNERLHRWIPWIAGFSSSFVEYVLDSLISPRKKRVKVLDPFSGVGTTLVESLKKGYDTVGFEINPYAALACSAKLHAPDYDTNILEKRIKEYETFMESKLSTPAEEPASSPPSGFKSKSPFFSGSIEKQVLYTLDYINGQKQAWLKDIFKLSLGSIMVGVSNYSYEPSLCTRSSAGKKDIEEADVAGAMINKLEQISDDILYLKEIISAMEYKPSGEVYIEDFLKSHDKLGKGAIDILITSPPYLNNYHYVRNTRPQLYWLDLVDSQKELKELEQTSFGKYWQTVRSGPGINLSFTNNDLQRLLDLLKEQKKEKGVYGGKGWANYAASYFNDCHRLLEAMKKVLKKNAPAVIVIGNNILQGIEFRTDEILADMASGMGYKVVELHRVRTKRTGSSIVNSSVRVGENNGKAELYETAVELRA